MKLKLLLCAVAVISGVAGGAAAHLFDQIVHAQNTGVPTEVRAQSFIVVNDQNETLLTIRSANDNGRQALEIFDAKGPVATMGPVGGHTLGMR